MKIIKECQDLTYLSWNKVRHSSGTAGSYLKAKEEIEKKKYYYKLSDYDSQRGIVGHECVNEIIVDRLLTAFGIEHLDYQLIHARIDFDGIERETYLCKSIDFKKPGEKKVALEDYYMSNKRPGERPLDFCIRMGYSEYVYRMLVVDYIILNRDRHGANVEVLKNSDGSIRLAPLFDHGISLLYDTYNPTELTKSDLLKDVKVNDFVGTGRPLDNLSLIPKDSLPDLPKFNPTLIDQLFEDMDGIIGDEYIEKIGEMLKERWKFYEVFRNQK